ncbi:hypothetical protein Smp_027820 [Schistosoma mansoni]|uniref:hypothetical protein n=1 Tax=Schistosoma mansoni TaxID=6183 RepID=UPI00022C8430|nr:hypothetical protein Smp_027820 [Schistosoma mansoni]|eukprot:XP_018646905.1 hypothetical protein Smp_027820 [Schistosoma mansoni]
MGALNSFDEKLKKLHEAQLHEFLSQTTEKLLELSEAICYEYVNVAHYDIADGRLYFGAKYEVIFSLKFNPSLSTSIVKYPVLAEIVCKPYERSIPVVNSCAKQKFYKFRSPLRVELDYTYVGPSVEQIIAYTNPLGILFGLGSNGGGAIMSKDLGNTWISVNSFVYQKTLNTSTEIVTASVMPWISLSGSIDNTLFESFCKMRVAQQWNGK